MSDVTLLHYTPGQMDLVMTKVASIEAALEKARSIDLVRQVYLSVSDVQAPNGIRLTKVERDEGTMIHVEPTGSQVTNLHNTAADKEVKRFATRGHAIEKTTKVLSERIQQQKESEKVEAQVQSETVTSKVRAGGGRPKVHADDMVVVLKVTENPKKPGKENHRRFDAMMKVMTNGRCTVAEAVAAGATRPDLVYDEEHKFIEVVQA